MKKHSTTQTALEGILKHSPILLLVSMLLSFLLVALVQTFYYSNFVLAGKVGTAGIAYAMAIGIALMTQFARVAFGISGAYEFGNGKTGKGILGLLFSLALSVFESFEVGEIAHVWAKDDPSLLFSSVMFLQFLVWVGFSLEIRLALLIAKKTKEENQEVEEKVKAETDQERLANLYAQNPALFQVLKPSNGSTNGQPKTAKKG